MTETHLIAEVEGYLEKLGDIDPADVEKILLELLDIIAIALPGTLAYKTLVTLIIKFIVKQCKTA